ncbi:CvpA family protein [Parabacteroides sp. AM08-6]|uniref:CvpA family protein n=1 Tax=Parabacteroides sp. AM08-6 TaxID=2292053 RepID=UPI000EFF0A7B|nr:CvpA family protein [Parabacteroides sp. AM08-6]RHJ86455.1 CvpA family protein [Parabacteroides sp. AM08-6]
MNWLDITLLCLAGIGFMKGLFDGVIKQVVSLIALLLAIFFCAKAADWLRSYIVELGWFPAEGVTIISYVVGFLLIVGIVLLAGEIVHRLVGATPLSVLNHLAGGVFGLCMMLLFVSLLFNAMEIIDRGSVLIPRQAKVESRLYNSVIEIIPTIYPGNLFTR